MEVTLWNVSITTREHSHHPPKNPMPTEQSFPFPFFQPLQTIDPPSISIRGLLIVEALYKQNCTLYDLLWLAFFTSVFQALPCCSTYQSFTPFYGWTTFSCIYWLHYVLVRWWHSHCFHFLPIMKMLLWTVMSQSLCDTCFHLSCVGTGLLIHMLTPCLTFWETDKLFQRGFTISYSHQQFRRAPISPYSCQLLLWSFYYIHCSRCKVNDILVLT